MKKIIQVIIFFILVILSLSLYFAYFDSTKNRYFTNDNLKEYKSQDIKSVEKKINKNGNLIKNLEYEVKLNENDKYFITSENSEIIYKSEKEIVNMSNVIAIIRIHNKLPITIRSNKATYDNSSYKTIFKQNVEIDYLDNKIYSDEVEIDFKKELILISNNVKLKNNNFEIAGDQVKVDIKKNKLDMYMNENKKKIKVFANN